jgi:hypothetical protein
VNAAAITLLIVASGMIIGVVATVFVEMTSTQARKENDPAHRFGGRVN